MVQILFVFVLVTSFSAQALASKKVNFDVKVLGSCLATDARGTSLPKFCGPKCEGPLFHGSIEVDFADKPFGEGEKTVDVTLSSGEKVPLSIYLGLAERQMPGYLKSTLSASLSPVHPKTISYTTVGLKDLSALDFLFAEGPTYTFNRRGGVEIRHFVHMIVSLAKDQPSAN